MYDHPPVEIYRKTDAYSTANARRILDPASAELAVAPDLRDGGANALLARPDEAETAASGATFDEVLHRGGCVGRGAVGALVGAAGGGRAAVDDAAGTALTGRRDGVGGRARSAGRRRCRLVAGGVEGGRPVDGADLDRHGCCRRSRFPRWPAPLAEPASRRPCRRSGVDGGHRRGRCRVRRRARAARRQPRPVASGARRREADGDGLLHVDRQDDAAAGARPVVRRRRAQLLLRRVVRAGRADAGAGDPARGRLPARAGHGRRPRRGDCDGRRPRRRRADPPAEGWAGRSAIRAGTCGRRAGQRRRAARRRQPRHRAPGVRVGRLVLRPARLVGHLASPRRRHRHHGVPGMVDGLR